MKKMLITAILGLLVIAQPAAAQWRHQGGRSYDGGRHLGVQSQRPRQGGYDRGQPPARDFRQPDRRDFRQPERGGDYRQPDRRHDGRLNDEERSNLRRDLDRANREIYKGR
ncbi:MAG TPA: hypothetical protein VEW70_10450 [Burkholderiales bacterium]|nr:hypothetical protein [Burkholderiales bacterium]